MPWPTWSLGSRIRSWLRDYDRIQALAVHLLYVQIACALIGSVGALYNGVLLVNLVVALFALVAIESGSQGLGRTYAVLLLFAILLDTAWFILFSHTIWNINPETNETFLVFSLRVTLSMQIVGFSVRFLSSFLWIQMYRLGASSVSNVYREADYDLRNSFLSPATHEIARQTSNSDEILGGSIYNPAYYSSLFEDVHDRGSLNEAAHLIIKNKNSEGDRQYHSHDAGSTSSTEAVSQLKSCIGRSFQIIDVDSSPRKPQRS